MGARLEIEGLVKHFGGATAVAGVDLSVAPGEFVSLLGPSGCGKTTTLRMIAGLEQADAGSIWIDGNDVTHVPARQRGIGMVFQQYALFPNLSAYENIAFSLRVKRWNKAKIDERVRDLLDTVHLLDAAKKYPHELSGGMQQRVALARALAIAPPVLLLDEPLSALDAAIRESLRTELRRLHRQLGVTVVYVTHDQSEAMALSDRVVVMEKGRVSQTGTPQELYRRPSTEFTAGFVGANNLLQTRILSDAKGHSIQWGDAELPVVAPDLRSIGDRVVASWRPESAFVTLVDPDAPERNGTIELVTFLGPITRLDIRFAGAREPVMVDIPSDGADQFTPGRSVQVTIPPAAINLFAGGGRVD